MSSNVAQKKSQAGREEAMILEKMIDELYELSKKAIASGIHISFEIGLAGYPCRVWVEEPPESLRVGAHQDPVSKWTKTVYHPLIVEEKERKINENIKNFSR